MSCLQARGVTFSYAHPGRSRPGAAEPPPQIRSVDIDIGEGEFVALLGPNGAGKTTLLRLLGGMLRPLTGSVTLFGRVLDSLGLAQKALWMAFVPQESRPTFDFSVLELVLLGRWPHLGLLGIEGKRDVEIARESLRFTGVVDLAGRPFGSLSAGEKQRVLLARALAQQARVVLLDEPTAFLDLGHQVRIYELLRRLCREFGTTLLVASHDLNLAGRYCGRLVLMHQGEVVRDGAPREVLTEELIRSTYGVEAQVRHDPVAGPIIIARGSPP